jgi:predicted house-cleaning noncanonical NTP pyrophosphatase (MazG superfamily)
MPSTHDQHGRRGQATPPPPTGGCRGCGAALPGAGELCRACGQASLRGRPSKLVRDRVPELMGPRWAGHAAGPVEYLVALAAKLTEEVGEYLAGRDPGELADVLEVALAVPAAVDQLAAGHGLPPGTVEAWRHAKAARRGGLTGRLIWHGEPDPAPPGPAAGVG